MSYFDKPKTIGEVLQALIDEYGYRERIDETRAIEEWAHLAGPQINSLTQSVWMERGRLHIKLTSPAWRQELHMRRSEWRDRLNQQLGREVVDEIVFR